MEHKRMYYLEDLSNEDGTKWTRLLEYAFRHSDSVEFTVPMNEQQWSPRLKPLLPFLTERYTSHWRWQAKQKKAQTFLRFPLVPTVEALLRIPQTLQDTLFLQPPFPEDPTFYSNGQALLWTITHEVWAYLLLTEEEAEIYRAQGFTFDVSFEAEPPTRREE
jgi:hypothetical protein